MGRVSRAEYLQQYLRNAADIIGLRDWEISYEPEDSPPDEAEARICALDNQRAFIGLAPKFWTHPPEQQRRILTHELVHLHFDRFSKFAELIEPQLAASTFQLFADGLEQAEEQAVEALARVLSQALPLPKFPKADA
jgi:hypothetical protein